MAPDTARALAHLVILAQRPAGLSSTVPGGLRRAASSRKRLRPFWSAAASLFRCVQLVPLARRPHLVVAAASVHSRSSFVSSSSPFGRRNGRVLRGRRPSRPGPSPGTREPNWTFHCPPRSERHACGARPLSVSARTVGLLFARPFGLSASPSALSGLAHSVFIATVRTAADVRLSQDRRRARERPLGLPELGAVT